MNATDYHDLFDRLAKSYPAESLWKIGRSEPVQWFEIVAFAAGDAPVNSPFDTDEYWQWAYMRLEQAAEAMVLAELLTMGG